MFDIDEEDELDDSVNLEYFDIIYFYYLLNNILFLPYNLFLLNSLCNYSILKIIEN